MNVQEAVEYLHGQGLVVHTIAGCIFAGLPDPASSDDFPISGPAIWQEGSIWIAHVLAGQRSVIIQLSDHLSDVVKVAEQFCRLQQRHDDKYHLQKVFWYLQNAGLAAAMFSDSTIRVRFTHKVPGDSHNVFQFMLDTYPISDSPCEFMLTWEPPRWMLTDSHLSQPSYREAFDDVFSAVKYLAKLHRERINCV